MRRSRSEEALGRGSGAQWGAEPERVDPDDYPPLHRFVRALTWTACETCGIQVHALASQFLLAGIACPTCGARLLEPPEDGAERLRVLLRQEDELSRQFE
jgi:hypothetical protein